MVFTANPAKTASSRRYRPLAACLLGVLVLAAGCGDADSGAVQAPPKPANIGGMDPGALTAIMIAIGKAEKAPRSPAARENLALVYMAHNEPDLAQQAIAQSLALDDSRPSAHYYCAIVADQVGQAELCLQHINQAMALDPGNPVPVWRAATWAMKAGDLEKARTLAEQAAALPDSDTSSRKVLAQVFLAEGRGEDAMKLLVPIVKNNNQDRYARYLLGRALQVMGRDDEAGRQIALAGDAPEMLEDPLLAPINGMRNDLAANRNRTQAMARAKRFQQSKALNDQLLVKYGAQRELVAWDALMLAELSQYDEAIAKINGLVEEHPDWQTGWIRRASIHQRSARFRPELRSGHLAIALKSARKATEVAPKDLSAWNSLYLASVSNRLPRTTIEAVEKMVELEPTNLKYRAAQAEAFMRNEQNNNAEATLDAMDATFGPSLQSMLLRIQVFMATGRVDEARKLLDQCLAIAPQNPQVLQLKQRLGTAVP
ncbi:MAG: hypothetical protein MK085_07390 [Phycisphaerales bacterium]|nr:hypothetical protein [Phycisphaerales bacterium]